MKNKICSFLESKLHIKLKEQHTQFLIKIIVSIGTPEILPTKEEKNINIK